MDIMERIDHYFDTVSDEKLFADVKAAGFVVVSRAAFYHAEKRYSMIYSRTHSHYDRIKEMEAQLLGERAIEDVAEAEA